MDRDLRISTGIEGLDQTLDYLRWGDTVTWQIENMGDYVFAVTQLVASVARTGQRIVYLRFADHMEVVVLRDGAEKTLIFTDLYNAEKGANFMDTTIANGRKKVGVGFAVRESVAYCWEMAGLVFKSLGMLFTREASIQDMAGPVGIVQLLGQAAESGWYTVLNLCTLLSVNLGVFNLFPIPALDGGRILFILIEWIRGKPVPPEKEGMVHLIGMGLLLILVGVVTFNDVLRLIRG